MKRASGILLPVSSLPTKYGIGGFSKEAYAFTDQLERAGQSYWQILPLGPTGYGDSPYQSFSTFAGNPYFISLDTLKEEGLLTREDCLQADASEGHPEYVDYGKIWDTRYQVLHKAFSRFDRAIRPSDYDAFREENADWLGDYCLYSAIKSSEGQKSWDKWPEPLKMRDPDALEDFRKTHGGEIAFYEFLQYEFDRQWKALKNYANGLGIRIIGDIPIYVAMDSADAWAEPALFQFDETLRPTVVAGVPPDAFSATGQLWGNPLYDWARQKADGYSWWIRRMRHMRKLYDVIRIDHFRGFNDYWSIPYGDRTAENGHWEKGPGLSLFHALEEALGRQEYIAEDLGSLNDEVREMVRNSGYPGMKVLLFAFDSDSDNVYLPHHYGHNAVVYTGTHDNDTAAGWLKKADRKVRHNLKAYFGHPVKKPEDLVRLAMASTADLAVIPMQDWLGLDNSARINTPSTLGDNWKWRLLPGQFSDETAARIARMTEVYSRGGVCFSADKNTQGRELRHGRKNQ